MPFPFVSLAKINRGLKVVDADLDAIRLGLMRDHFLIEVEYMSGGSMVIEQVFHKSKNDMMLFFNRDDINIVNCRCLEEREFLSYISEKNRIHEKDRRADSRLTHATASITSTQHESDFQRASIELMPLHPNVR
jgi:predicted PolB exonuclease-like 3'-5' exonuclease